MISIADALVGMSNLRNRQQRQQQQTQNRGHRKSFGPCVVFIGACLESGEQGRST
jgi:hypothetical protein